MKLMDVAVDFEQFHVEPNAQADIVVSASVTPSQAWPAEQARYSLDSRLGMSAAVLSVANGTPLSSEAVCQFSISAKMFNLIDTGAMNLERTFALGPLVDAHGEAAVVVDLAAEVVADFVAAVVLDYAEILQKMFRCEFLQMLQHFPTKRNIAIISRRRPR